MLRPKVLSANTGPHDERRHNSRCIFRLPITITANPLTPSRAQRPKNRRLSPSPTESRSWLVRVATAQDASWQSDLMFIQTSPDCPTARQNLDAESRRLQTTKRIQRALSAGILCGTSFPSISKYSESIFRSEKLCFFPDGQRTSIVCNCECFPSPNVRIRWLHA